MRRVLPRRKLLVALLAAAACRSTPYREVEIDFAAATAATDASTAPEAAPHKLRFSVAAMQSPRATHAAYARLVTRIGKLLGVAVELVQRRTYLEVNDLLAINQVDVAFVCTGGYLDLKQRAPSAVSLLAVPVVDGKTTYQSLVIVPTASPSQHMGDLAGKRFAFTDALSFTGHLYARHHLRTIGRAPVGFFGATLFTQSHDRSIRAVAKGLVDGAAVDSLIYDTLVKTDPSVAKETRVIHRSPPFGIPPVVASNGLSQELKARIAEVFLRLHADAEANAALREIHIENFTRANDRLYDTALVVMKNAQ